MGKRIPETSGVSDTQAHPWRLETGDWVTKSCATPMCSAATISLKARNMMLRPQLAGPNTPELWLSSTWLPDEFRTLPPLPQNSSLMGITKFLYVGHGQLRRKSSSRIYFCWMSKTVLMEVLPGTVSRAKTWLLSLISTARTLNIRKLSS